jgi:hypothetical protein
MVTIAASEPVKKVTGRFFELVINFIEASKKYKIKYHVRKLFKNLKGGKWIWRAADEAVLNTAIQKFRKPSAHTQKVLI